MKNAKFIIVPASLISLLYRNYSCFKNRTHTFTVLYYAFMAIELLTDERITELLDMQKRVINEGARTIRKDGCHRINYLAQSEDGEIVFHVYTRQNVEVENDFSCGIYYVNQSGETATLIRYNGSHHKHTNKLEDEEIGYTAHIHRATERYIDRKKIEGFATPTDQYTTLKGALFCMIKDCKITGLSSEPDNPELFTS